uniref:Uncharacterized protein n=1 Tax=Candidatus Kentrum eta TaxID=2126337 RepID=A0A450UHK4_9GAMM|nr:MAG: hypothetical protein BECKH772A_GA0070896_100264 [Candidatus Kentron sp. H]VFJ92009.1 MAG: hypothetical protein BECKH772B_GA0070898_100244 [Candidatus Kentron sp. H]VFJ98591.1 MAG: hypothetical protein BECKH772C_GA0070978_100234 [Candidatus Kentron sp. H]
MTGFRPKLGNQSHWWIFTILAAILLLPVLVLWLVIQTSHTEIITQCDRTFWEIEVIKNPWFFPFRFFPEILLSYLPMWFVLLLAVAFAGLAFREKIHLLRPRDFPLGVSVSFLLLTAASGFFYWDSLDTFTKGRIEGRLDDRAERDHLLERNLDSLRIALDRQLGAAKTVQQLRGMAEGLRFTQASAHRMGDMKAGALFGDASSLPLFEGCRGKVDILVPIQDPSGFSKHQSVNVEVSLPIEYDRVAEAHWSRARLKYFHEVLGVGYLFGPMWWVYLLFLLSPVWAFFFVFILYRFRALKIRAAARSKGQ